MSELIHPTARINPSAELAGGVKVGPYAVIDAAVVIGEDTEVCAHAQITGPTTLGRENVIYPFASVGSDPQDLKFAGERTTLEVGDRNRIREFCSINRGTGKGGGVTRIGNDNLLMVYSHVGHDAQVGSHTVFSNNGTLAGHVEVGDWATIGAFSSVHQFCRVGAHAYIGGYSVITMDALPYAITVGEKPRCTGLNRIGLQRRGFSGEALRELEQAMRLLLRTGLNTTQALARLHEAPERSPEVDHLIRFIEASERGIIKARRRGSRGAGGE